MMRGWSSSICTNGALLLWLISLVYYFYTSFYLIQQESNKCEMTYSWPRYTRLSNITTMNDDDYQLYRVSQKTTTSKYEGVPVLFVPGHLGSYEQARSIGRHLYDEQPAVSFDLFALDLKSELSALSGDLIQQQSQFLNSALAYILSQYNNTTTTKSVLIVAHSMGGIVTRLAPLQSNYVNNSISIIITLSTPHVRPAFALDSAMQSLYSAIAEERNSAVVVSLAGGYRDLHIHSALTKYGDKSSSLTQALPNVKVSVDHLCLVWCHQLLKAVAKSLSAVVKAKDDEDHLIVLSESLGLSNEDPLDSGYVMTDFRSSNGFYQYYSTFLYLHAVAIFPISVSVLLLTFVASFQSKKNLMMILGLVLIIIMMTLSYFNTCPHPIDIVMGLLMAIALLKTCEAVGSLMALLKLNLVLKFISKSPVIKYSIALMVVIAAHSSLVGDFRSVTLSREIAVAYLLLNLLNLSYITRILCKARKTSPFYRYRTIVASIYAFGSISNVGKVAYAIRAIKSLDSGEMMTWACLMMLPQLVHMSTLLRGAMYYSRVFRRKESNSPFITPERFDAVMKTEEKNLISVEKCPNCFFEDAGPMAEFEEVQGSDGILRFRVISCSCITSENEDYCSFCLRECKLCGGGSAAKKINDSRRSVYYPDQFIEMLQVMKVIQFAFIYISLITAFIAIPMALMHKYYVEAIVNSVAVTLLVLQQLFLQLDPYLPPEVVAKTNDHLPFMYEVKKRN